MMRLLLVSCLICVSCGGPGTRQETIAGYRVMTFAGDHFTLTHVDLGESAWAVFKGPKDPGGDTTKCLGCKISKISECANEVCPPIKKIDPERSCSDEIRRCTERKCKDSGDCKTAGPSMSLFGF